MILSTLLFSMMSALLWVPIVVIGTLRLRAMPRPSFLLIGAGIVGFVERITTPALTATATGLLFGPAGGIDNYQFVQLGVWAVGSLLSAVPWLLLLIGVWRFVVAHPRADLEAPRAD